jgi:hypothetical protein
MPGEVVVGPGDARGDDESERGQDDREGSSVVHEVVSRVGGGV